MKSSRASALLLLCLLSGVQAAECKLLFNPFHRQKQADDQPFGSAAAGQLAQKPVAKPDQHQKMPDAAFPYTNSLWGPNSPLLGEKNPKAMKRYRKLLRKAHHRHFWQRGI